MSPHVAGVDPAINWLLVSLADDAGEAGVGEGTLEGANATVGSHLEALAADIVGKTPGEALARTRVYPGSLPEAAALGALNQALWDLIARQQGEPLAVVLDGSEPAMPMLYANINRAVTGERSPLAFADAAVSAAEQGYSAVKIAPFDGVDRRPLSDPEVRRGVDAGLDRITAVLDAVDVELRVDLHWRFETSAACTIVGELSELSLGWIEAPVREGDLEAWRTVRESTTAILAGGVSLTSPEDFDVFLSSARADVVMPDIKYCGGVDGFRRCLGVAQSHNADVAPHNPSGPVATLATLHAAGHHGLQSLEVAWRPQQAPLGVLEGSAVCLPEGPGLAFAMPTDLLERFPPRAEPATAPTDLI